MAEKRDDQFKIGLSYQKDAEILALLSEIATKYQGLRMTRTTVVRIFVEERAELYESGWKLNDPVLRSLLNRIVREPHVAEICQTVLELAEKDLEHMIGILRASQREVHTKDV